MQPDSEPSKLVEEDISLQPLRYGQGGLALTWSGLATTEHGNELEAVSCNLDYVHLGKVNARLTRWGSAAAVVMQELGDLGNYLPRRMSTVDPGFYTFNYMLQAVGLSARGLCKICGI